MAGCAHSLADHEDLKQPGVWEGLEFVGYQPGDAVHGDMELRNIPGCGSTIARRIWLTEEHREQIRAEVRAKNEAFRRELEALMGRAA